MRTLSFLGLIIGFIILQSSTTETKFESTQNQGIEFFQGTWAQALEKAKAENKLIFLDAYASWCGPCRRMSSQVFTQTKPAEFYNKNFINVKVDMEKGEGPALAQKYKVRAYPSLFFIDANGIVKKQALGYKTASELIEFGKSVL